MTIQAHEFVLRPRTGLPRSSRAPLGLGGTGPGETVMLSSVEQYGITWYFDGEYECGQYCNGDWFVVGPVTITSITPESEEVDGRWMNGSELNPPSSGQGYDSNTASRIPYSHETNVAPSVAGALTLEEGSIVSSISDPNPSSETQPIYMLAILTVVTEAPPAGAFRPPPYIEDKTSSWSESQLDYSILQSLPSTSSAPNDLSALSETALKFWNEQGSNWTGAYVMATHAGSGYGRDLATRTNTMALALHLDFTNSEKRNLFIGLVQYGIDNYGRILRGGNWHADGGWHHGRKVPTLMAGLALNDPNILYWVKRRYIGDPSYAGEGDTRNLFQEDGTTFIVSESDVGRPTEEEFPSHATWEEERVYLEEDVGNPEWGIRYWQVGREWADRRWGASYRFTGSQFVGLSLAARMMNGGYDAWDWPPFFEYVERYLDVGPLEGISAFHQEMWNDYNEQFKEE